MVRLLMAITIRWRYATEGVLAHRCYINFYVSQINRTCRVPHADRNPVAYARTGSTFISLIAGTNSERIVDRQYNDTENTAYCRTAIDPATTPRGSLVSVLTNNKAGVGQETLPTSGKPSQQWFVLPVKFTIHPALPPSCLHFLVMMGKPLFSSAIWLRANRLQLPDLLTISAFLSLLPFVSGLLTQASRDKRL